jgi:hypothetical protein
MELSNLFTSVKDHPELSLGDFVFGSNYYTSLTPVDHAHTLPDGSEFMVKFMDLRMNGENSHSHWSLVEFTEAYQTRGGAYINIAINGNEIHYLAADPWMSLFEDITTKMDDVRDGLITWVNGVYGDVQSGELSVSDLVTPRERAAMMSEEEGTSQAIVDLIALNIPVDLERVAAITINDTGATLIGTFGLTDSSDGPIESGTTYEPSTFAGDIYLTADMSLVSTATETQFETLQLDGSFTVDKLMNTESGEEVSTTSFDNAQPQTDDNYVSQEEWDDLEQQNQDLIEKFENSQNNGGGGMIFDRLGGGAIPREGLIVGGAALLIALLRR